MERIPEIKWINDAHSTIPLRLRLIKPGVIPFNITLFGRKYHPLETDQIPYTIIGSNPIIPRIPEWSTCFCRISITQMTNIKNMPSYLVILSNGAKIISRMYPLRLVIGERVAIKEKTRHSVRSICKIFSIPENVRVGKGVTNSVVNKIAKMISRLGTYFLNIR
jgi:hypothetical protein